MKLLCGELALVVRRSGLLLEGGGPNVSEAGEEKENIELESPSLEISLLALPVNSKTGELALCVVDRLDILKILRSLLLIFTPLCVDGFCLWRNVPVSIERCAMGLKLECELWRLCREQGVVMAERPTRSLLFVPFLHQ